MYILLKTVTAVMLLDYRLSHTESLCNMFPTFKALGKLEDTPSINALDPSL